MKNYKKIIATFIALVMGIGLAFSQTCNTTAPSYTTINTPATSGTFTTSSEWVAGNNPPFVLNSGAYTIPAGVVVDIASSNFQLDHNLIVYGTLLIEGKLVMTSNSATITVMSGGLVTCCATGYCGSSCATCTGNAKVTIGGSNVYCGIGCGSVNGSFTGFAVLSNTGLPIKLSSFTGEQKGNGIELKWRTETELNFDYINLQKSDNGREFSSIAKVAGHGTTNVAHDYSYTDATPFIGMNYYQLTSFDFDNYQETFKVIAVNYTGERNISFSPNPATDQITFNSNFDFDGKVSVYNNYGLLVNSFDVNGTNMQLNINELRSGLYVFKVEGQNISKAFRIVIN